jgi:hypothetical protein
MPDENATVIVSYQRLNEKVSQALGKNPEAIREATQAPAPEGLESDEPPATDAEAAAFMEELQKALSHLEGVEQVPGVLVAPDDRFTSLLQSHLARKSLEEQKVEPTASGGLEAQFDEHDVLGWAKSLFTWVQKLRPHPWVTAAPSADPLPNTVRAAVLGDWGSGLYGAPACAASIRNDAKDYGLLLHLGDVYYSGTRDEINDRFLKLWPDKPNAIHRACNANHEMYTGGRAYFKQVLPKFNQQASYFALQNDHWLLVGLDTAYDDGSLHGDQLAWLQGLMNAAGDRRVVLFSHHQLYTWVDKPSGKLQTQLAELLNSKKLFAWYWGHEHRCMLFDQHPGWGLHGRCVGHSGFPYWRDHFTEGTVESRGPQDTAWRRVGTKNLVPGGLILEGPNPYVPGEENKYGPNGYMTLELDGPHLNEIVHAPDGSIQYDRQLV